MKRRPSQSTIGSAHVRPLCSQRWRGERLHVRRMERDVAMQREGLYNGGHAATLGGGALGGWVVNTRGSGR